MKKLLSIMLSITMLLTMSTAVLADGIEGSMQPAKIKVGINAQFPPYEGEYSAIVSFSEYGVGVISANMAFVKNGEKDNVFRRLYEITSAVGEGAVNIAKIK